MAKSKKSPKSAKKTTYIQHCDTVVWFDGRGRMREEAVVGRFDNRRNWGTNGYITASGERVSESTAVVHPRW